ncbi:MAG: hypothetical protein U0517_03570 [Candidatus Andersenbacteria bacterium]
MTERAAAATPSALRLANFNTFNPKTSLHFAETYVFRPKQLASFGELFVVLQIDHATKSSPQVGDAVATILNHEYFRGNPTNVVQNLEDALHKTNEILSDLAARGEIHWIGKLHAVIGVFQKDTIHLSASGRGKAFLVRDGEIAEVTAGLYDSSRAASPMKTFENLASGELREGDTLILTTPGVTDYVTPEALRTILENKEPVEAVKTIQTRVSHDAAAANASVVFRYSKQQLSPAVGIGVSAAPHVHTYESEPPAKEHKEQLATVAPTSGRSAAAPQKKKSVLAGVTGFFSALTKRISGLVARRGRSRSVSKDKPVSAARESIKTPQMDATASSNRQKTSVGSLWTRLKKAIIRMPARVKVFGALALLLVVIFVVSLVIFTSVRGSRQNQASITSQFSEAKKLEEDAAAAIIFHDLTQAQNLLKQAEEKLKGLPDNNAAIGSDLETLKGKIAADYEKLSGSVRINEPTKLASLSGNPLGVTLLNGELVSWLSNGKISVVAIKDGDTATAATLSKELGQPLVGAVDESQLVLLTDEDSAVGFEDGKLKELEMGGTFAPKQAVAVETYGNRLYVLDAGKKEITRHQRTIAGYGQGSSWILDGTSIEGAVDLAIDGNVWVLKSDGSIIKFLQGSKEDFTLGPVVDPLESPTRIVTSEDSKYLYILEPKKKRLLQFDKEKGDFIKQFVSDAFTDLRDMAIIDKGAKAYLLNGDSVFEIDLNK